MDNIKTPESMVNCSQTNETMDQADRDRIRKNYVVLVRELPTREVLGYFLLSGLFSMHDAEGILECTPSWRNEAILDVLKRRGPRGMVCLCQALDHAGRVDLIEKLIQTQGDDVEDR